MSLLLQTGLVTVVIMGGLYLVRKYTNISEAGYIGGIMLGPLTYVTVLKIIGEIS